MNRVVMTRTPLRVSFVGGGSDLPGPNALTTGATISSAIDKHVYVVAKRRDDDKVILHWREREEVASAHDLKHDLVREVLKMLGVTNGIEIITFADVPGVGSGLGSSSATTVGLLHAIASFDNSFATPSEWLARIACEIELKRLGGSGGEQDQYICAYGGLRYMEHRDGHVISNQEVPLDGFNRRRLSDEFLLFSPKNKKGRDAEVILSKFEDSADFREDCWRLACSFKERVEEGNYDFSYLLHAHHNLKMKHFSYMCEEIEIRPSDPFMYKLCGAGGTGHLLVVASKEYHSSAIRKFEETWGPNLPFKLVPYGSEVVYAEQD